SMSSEERSPKRQRISYNTPRSPSQESEGVKSYTHVQTNQEDHIPHTPPPSVHMSPSWQAQQAQSNSSEHSQAPLPSPPSTAGLHSQGTQRQESSDTGNNSGTHTPMQSQQQQNPERTDGDGDELMGGVGSQQDIQTYTQNQSTDAEHRKTNHERQEARDILGPLPLYKLSTEPIAPILPSMSTNILELYDLTRIQGSVARRDASGQKINRLRKSYQGKAKELGLEGNLKATEGGRELEGLADPGWDSVWPDGRTAFQVRHTETMLEAPSQKELLAKLDDAFSLGSGQLPQAVHNEWKDYLKLDDIPPPKPTNPLKAVGNKGAASNLLSKTSPGAAIRSSAPASPRNLSGRPDRPGRKRRYDDSSFSGYQEGYEDDGYSTGGDAGRKGGSIKRQKRKEYSATASPSFHPGSSSNGMVGIRSS
ncbi:Rox3-domain-containing protein, partial [Polychaeton citri CBS 116435]